MQNATARNWTEMGIYWTKEQVSKNFGTRNASDIRVVGEGPIMVVNDLGKFRVHFGDEAVLGILDGTSVRVHSQAVIRPLLIKNRLHSFEDMQEQVYNRIRGARGVARQTVTITVEKIVLTLPNGETFEGDSFIAYQQAFVSALVEMGVDAGNAIAKAQSLALPKGLTDDRAGQDVGAELDDEDEDEEVAA